MSAPPTRRVSNTTIVIVACVGLAALSLLVQSSIGFDPWAWLVWGREVGRFELDTTAGASWKPLPVVFTTPLSLLGDAAPWLWLVVARAAGLLLLVGTFRLAARHAGALGGAIAAALVLLTPDAEPRFLRTVAEGHDAPMSAALAVWAVERHLAGRYGTTLVLVTALSLLRPEAWPFLVLYATWLWFQRPTARVAVAFALVSVPVLWLGGDWWGSGDPFHGAELARVGDGDDVDSRLTDALERLAGVVVFPAWIAAGWGAVTAWGRRESDLLAIAVGVAVWCGLVVGMAAVFGYAALSRFYLPAAALVCVLAGVGFVRLVERAPAGTTRTVVVAGVVACSAPFVIARAMGIGDVFDEVRDRTRLQVALPDAVEAAGGRDALLGCGAVASEGTTLLRPAVAWELDIPIARVSRAPVDPPVVVVSVAGGTEDQRISSLPISERRLLARTDEWAVHAVGCAPG